MQTQPEVGAPDHARIILGLEPARAQLNPTRRQTGKSPLELGAPLAVAGHEDNEIRKAPAAARGFPAADAMLEPDDGIDDHVEIFVFGPAGRTHDEADGLGMNAEARKQRLPMPLAIDPLDWHERRRRPIVEHMRVGHAEPAFEKRGEPARHAQVRFDPPRIAPLEPPRQPDRRMPVAEPKPQQRVSEIVPVDEEPHAAVAERPPRDREGRKGGRILDEHDVRPRQPPQRLPQPQAEPHRIEQSGDRVARPVEAPADPQPCALDPMDGQSGGRR